MGSDDRNRTDSPTSAAHDAQNTRNYYNQFSRDKLAKDIEAVNLRQIEAIKLCEDFIEPRGCVLEIGCGAGIITRELARFAGRVLAIDISDANVDLARRVASSANVDVVRCDVKDAKNFSQIAGDIAFDAVVMVDVIEHIPLCDHADLVSRIEASLIPGGRLILTFPSPDYQKYIYRHDRRQVQIIDEVVQVGQLLTQTSLQPIHLRSVDVWRKRQYIHLVLQKPGPDDLAEVTFGRGHRYFFALRRAFRRLRRPAHTGR